MARDMAWIKTADPDKATGKTKKVFERIMKERGHIANIFLAQGLDPDMLEHHLDIYEILMLDPGPLSRGEREMIAVIVSAANRSAYGAIHPKGEGVARIRGQVDHLTEGHLQG
jgi:uncharacterized peroxidase-related enzyme